MKLTFISDTHSLHKTLAIESGDILIHCGDFTNKGSLEDTESFAHFMSVQDFRYKVVIAGNHDFCFEDDRKEEAEQYLADKDIIYLNDSGTEIEGLKIWGSPVQPEFFNWAFNRERGEDICKHWDLIPSDTDILVTHGPAFGILDRVMEGERVGCRDLLDRVKQIKPKIHAFGHIHEDYGVLEQGDTTFVNACNVNRKYWLVNPPIVVET